MEAPSGSIEQKVATDMEELEPMESRVLEMEPTDENPEESNDEAMTKVDEAIAAPSEAASIKEETMKAPETPASRKEAILGRLSKWRMNSPVVDNLITTTQRRVASTGVFASPLSSARLSPAHSTPNKNDLKQDTSKNDTKKESYFVPQNDQSLLEEEYDDDDDSSAAETASDAGSFVSQSTRTSGGSSTFHLAWAAASVVDSVQTQFRGRYASGGTNAKTLLHPNMMAHPSSKSMTTTNTQLSRMLSSSQHNHIQTLVNDLASHQYMMLLGRGMLGVNLKQCYLRNAGVYVDYLVQGGAADQTRHVYVGDLLQKVGSASVEKGTILEIPKQIANAKRPLHLIWATGTPTSAERMTAIDVCVGLMHHNQMQRKVYDEEEDEDDDDAAEFKEPGVVVDSTGDSSQFTNGSDFVEEKKSQEEAEPAALEQTQSGGSDVSTKADTGHADLRNMSISVKNESRLKNNVEDTQTNIEITYSHSIDGICNPIPLSLQVRHALQGHATKRNHEGFDALDLVQAAGSDANFYAAIQHGFLECVADVRRFPFLARHLSMLEDVHSDPDHESSNAVKSPNAMLMLFCELVNYMDLYLVTPDERKLEIANSIAYKFFLPTRLGNELVPPMFDFHQIAPDMSLRKLEAALHANDKTAVPRDIFFDFATAAMDSLTGYPFLSFLTSPECARMRAYLRNVAPFMNLPLDQVLTAASTDPSAKNYIYYIILFLLSLTDKEGFGEHDDLLSKGDGVRVEHAVGGICAALFINSELLPALAKAEDDATIIHRYEQLWEHFVDPNCGALEILPHTGGAIDSLKVLRLSLDRIKSSFASASGTVDERRQQLVTSLVDSSMKGLLADLANDLAFEYAANLHPKFREHKFHEWLCSEMALGKNDNDKCLALSDLANGCIKRLLRKTNLPNGVAPHKPTHINDDVSHSGEATSAGSKHIVAEYAVIFGSADQSQESKHSVQRYACQLLIPERNGLTPDDVPATLESYAIMSPLQSKPFNCLPVGTRISADGWAVTLQNFVVPRADAASESGEEAPLYGVSLVFQKVSSALTSEHVKINEGSVVDAHDDLPLFNQRLHEESWIDWSSTIADRCIGIALVSQRNTMLSMRDTLSRILQTHASREGCADRVCLGLINILGNFRHADIEPQAILSIFRSPMDIALSPWRELPNTAQAEEFEQVSGRHLLESLPPIPLALLFTTALLEQKIVFTSSRRSLLLSATTALSKLLRPLRWWHLMVPCVPASLAGDLLQYPAPFILGMSTEDSGIMEHIRDLPRDVTLVDLDVGRVILAPSFAKDCELGRGVPNNVDTSRALRQQVLFMSQALGGVFGSVIYPDTWGIDGPEANVSHVGTAFDRLCNVCREFVDELLAGTGSCCYWIEEANATEAVEPTVLFDEDRFFHVKNLRASEGFAPLFGMPNSSKLAITLEDFDLILEVFLRCQSMNVYIGSRNKNQMALSL
ncbi:hypothetical protein MPSEU_001043600 [Mayamaea pseudoterrestris]|nr:hypothetical protein MPSEU_001043600 [Mayamaea pseudoterrestris]